MAAPPEIARVTTPAVPTVIFADLDPRIVPVVASVVASVTKFLFTVKSSNVAPITVTETVDPATGLPNTSVTLTDTGIVVPIAADAGTVTPTLYAVDATPLRYTTVL